MGKKSSTVPKENRRSKEEIKERVRERYASAARAFSEATQERGQPSSCCGDANASSDSTESSIAETPQGEEERSQSSSCCGDQGVEIGTTEAISMHVPECDEAIGSKIYSSDDQEQAPDTAIDASLGCGNPTAIAELNPAESVLDLGSGGGIDVFLAAKKVGPQGRVFGVDMTDEMIELARKNQRKAGVLNVEFLKGEIENLPLDDNAVDVIISNCVINLSADKQEVFKEAARVLRPGGRVAISDIVADVDMDEETRADLAQWTGCISGALTKEEYASGLRAAGFQEVQIKETSRVHPKAAAASIRARLPG